MTQMEKTIIEIFLRGFQEISDEFFNDGNYIDSKWVQDLSNEILLEVLWEITNDETNIELTTCTTPQEDLGSKVSHDMIKMDKEDTSFYEFSSEGKKEYHKS